ncbi:MAG: LacI family DNA-binding transcriptional regulator [Armatimonadota bacterium]|nr:LacI family DNA-binding transcriptional regulator [Armatimonadota bacterium]
MSKTQPTIKDVARRAGVSHATVSYVLAGSKHASRISKETKLRVWAAAEELGYKFNPVGRALKRGHTDTILLLIVTWQMAKSHSQTAMALSRSATMRGLQLTVNIVKNDSEAESFLNHSMISNHEGLLVLWDSPAVEKSTLAQLANEGLPVIDLLPGAQGNIESVAADREHAGYTLTRHLIELGHQRIAFIGDTISRIKTTMQKYAGYERALREAGIDIDPSLMQNVEGFGFDGGFQGFQELITRQLNFTAVICINDPMALGAMACAQFMGMQCPRDISFAGYGAFDEGEYWHPSLTTVGLSADLVAESAVNEIVRLRNNPNAKRANIYIPGELIIRESTGPAP